MSDARCKECNRTIAELNESQLVYEDGLCEECLDKLMKEWEKDQKDQQKYWEDTRL